MGKVSEMLNKVKTGSSVTPKEQFGFAAGLFGGSMTRDTYETYADTFFRDYMGIESSALTALSAMTTGINLITDPIAGMLLDRPGKSLARPFLLGAGILLGLSSVLAFVVPTGSNFARVVYAFIVSLIFSITDSFFDISLMTISARAVTNPDDRKSFYTIAEFAGTLGSMLPGWIIPLIFDRMGGDHSKELMMFFTSATVFGAIGLMAMITPFCTLREKAVLVERRAKSTKIDFRAIIHNRPLLVLILAKMVDSVRQVGYNSLPYFYRKTLGKFSIKAVVDACSGTLSYIGMALVPTLSKRFSSRNLIISGYSFTGICYILFSILGYKSKLICCILIAIAGFPNGGMGALRRIMVADSTDYMEWKTYKKYGKAIRSEGMVYAANSLGGKVSQLWKKVLFSACMGAIGYKSNKVDEYGNSIEYEQTPEAIHRIFYLVVIPGIVGNILPALIMLFDDFTGKKKQMILEELVQIRALEGSSEEETAEEELTD